jgi:hypothetical protein
MSGNQGFLGWSQVSGTTPYINVQDQKPSGTAGGGTTTGSWLTHTLNTVVEDTASISSLAANQLTLPPGRYRARFVVVGFATGVHQARLQNITSGATLVTGTNCVTNTAINASDASEGAGTFKLYVQSVLELQQRVATSRGIDGFGSPTSWGTEVYAVLEVWKES